MLICLLILLVCLIVVYGILCLATYDKKLLPKYIYERPHDDWGIIGIPLKYQPWTWIPRRWTSWVLPMPPGKVAGNGTARAAMVQPNYPIASDALVWTDPSGQKYFLAMQPGYECGQWAILNVKLFKWLPRVPCYFTFSYLLFGKKLYFNIGLKPDLTYDGPGTDYNFHWGWPEMSVTWG